MGRAGDHRLIAARELVLPLGAGLDRPQPVRQGPFDRLIVAELEVEERHLLGAAPVAAVEGIAADDVQRPGDRPAVAQGEEQQQPLAHRPGDRLEEGARQIGPAPFARSGVLVERPHRVPFGRADLAPAQRDEIEPFARRRPFPADGLVLAAGQHCEEIVEAAVAAVEPMILDAVPNQPAAPLAFGRIGFVEECRVRRRNLVLEDDRLGGREQALRLRAEQPPAGHGRERHGDLELGIIAAAGALEGVGPAVVEHIFALAVGLEIGRRGGEQVGRIVLDEDRRRSPARALADAPRFLERRQEGVADEGIAAAEPIPGATVEAVDARCELGDDLGFAVGQSSAQPRPTGLN